MGWGNSWSEDLKELDRREGERACDRCQGNGEIVVDWEKYLHPPVGDKGDGAVAACPNCDGTGRIDEQAET